MADTPMVIRVAANLAELKKNLGEGKVQIETTTAAMTKLASSFSGDRLIQHAQNVVAAVEKIGGATKLTDAEQKRVNATLEKALAKYETLGREAPAGMRELANATTHTHEAMAGMVMGVSKADEYFKIFSGDATKGMMGLGAGVKETAQAMVDAVNKMGGVSKLTMSDQAAVNKTVAQAIAHYHALGQDAPTGLQQIADATRRADTTGVSWSSMLLKARGILATLGIGVSVTALINMAKALTADADALMRMHDRTEISVEGLQAMRIAGDDAGVSLESMTAAVNMLQKRLGGDDDSAVKALLDLGINLDKFKAMDGAQQMAAIAKAIKDIHDPLRVANDLSALFGRAWAEQLPVLKRGFAELTDGTRQMSTETVKILDSIGDAFGRFGRSMKAAAGEAFVSWLTGTSKSMRDLVSQVDAMTIAADKAAPRMKAMAPPGLPKDLDEINQRFERQRETLEANAKAAEENEKKAAAFVKVLERIRQIEPELKAGLLGLSDLEQRTTQASMERWLKTAEAAEKAQEKERAWIQSLYDEAVAQDKVALAMMRVTDTVRNQSGAVQQLAIDWETTKKAWGNYLQKGQPGWFGWSPTGAADAFINRALNVPMNPTIGAGGSYTPPPRAMGGSVSAGSSYVVGERGPEWFVPQTSGSIMPGGAGGITIAAGAIVINGSVLSSGDQLAAMIGDAMMRRLRGQGVRLPSGA